MKAAKDEDEPTGKPPHFSRRDWEALKEYVTALRDMLGLRDWTIFASHEIPEEAEDCNAIASIHPTDGRRRAVLRLARDFREMSPEEQRSALVHELLHLHHRDATDIIRLTLPKVLGGAAFDVLWEDFRQQIELITDNIAVAIAEGLPLPRWPKPKKKGKKR